MRPFFYYYGGKNRYAKHYPPPRYDVVIEPFAGAAGYSTAHGVDAALLADADPILAGVWDLLINADRSDVMSLPDLPLGADVRTLPIPPAAQDLIGFWLNHGVAKPRRTASAWSRDGRHLAWGPKVRERIAEQVAQIKRWGVLHTHYRTLPNFEATWFIDPPYAGRPGTHYTYGSSGIDYADLADWCRSRRGQVIVCEAQGADWLPFVPLGTFNANATSVGRRSAEAIWLAQNA